MACAMAYAMTCHGIYNGIAYAIACSGVCNGMACCGIWHGTFHATACHGRCHGTSWRRRSHRARHAMPSAVTCHGVCHDMAYAVASHAICRDMAWHMPWLVIACVMPCHSTCHAMPWHVPWHGFDMGRQTPTILRFEALGANSVSQVSFDVSRDSRPSKSVSGNASFEAGSNTPSCDTKPTLHTGTSSFRANARLVCSCIHFIVP